MKGFLSASFKDPLICRLSYLYQEDFFLVFFVESCVAFFTLAQIGAWDYISNSMAIALSSLFHELPQFSTDTDSGSISLFSFLFCLYYADVPQPST